MCRGQTVSRSGEMRGGGQDLQLEDNVQARIKRAGLRCATLAANVLFKRCVCFNSPRGWRIFLIFFFFIFCSLCAEGTVQANVAKSMHFISIGVIKLNASGYCSVVWSKVAPTRGNPLDCVLCFGSCSIHFPPASRL